MAGLVVEDLTVRLGRRTVLDGVTATLPAGKVSALLGPNGAGKTTLLRAILGVIPTTRGTIALPAGVARRECGYVPQHSDFRSDYPATCADAVKVGLVRGMWRALPRNADELVAKALDLVHMAGLAKRPIGELSGGQLQRVLVAKALVGRPSVLLLDEPFTGVDMPTQELLHEVFHGLEGVTVLMSTHDVPTAIATADHAVLLNQGVQASAAPDHLGDAALWATTFGVVPESPMLRTYLTAVEARIRRQAENAGNTSRQHGGHAAVANAETHQRKYSAATIHTGGTPR